MKIIGLKKIKIKIINNKNINVAIKSLIYPKENLLILFNIENIFLL